jgi:hypothetical protein
MNRFLTCPVLILATSVTLLGQFQSAHENPLPNWMGPIFALSQDHPKTRPMNQAMPMEGC